MSDGQTGRSSQQGPPSWQAFFGHETPYDHQRQAIERILKNSTGGGYTVIEGGCGTGKTMLSLAAGIRQVRDLDTNYSRVLVLTSVKQQIDQFTQDLSRINRNLPSNIAPVSVISLVGKGDVCPYTDDSSPEMDAKSVHRECGRVREGTRELIDQGYSPVELADRETPGSRWTVGGKPAPYNPEFAELDDTEYCAFYAKHKATPRDIVTPEDADDSVLSVNQLESQGCESGVCPHSVMATQCNSAEVIIGNYYHAFEPNSRRLTHRLIDDDTFVICDEAHMLVPRVRSVLSKSVELWKFSVASIELQEILASVDSDFEPPRNSRKPEIPHSVVAEVLGKDPIRVSTLRNTLRLLSRLRNIGENLITNHLDEEYPEWTDRLANLPRNLEIPLRDPEVLEQPDAVTEWADDAGVPESTWENIRAVGYFVKRVHDKIPGRAGNPKMQEVGSLLYSWWEQDHVENFRELELNTRSQWREDKTSWNRRYEANYSFKNCIPSRMIGSVLRQFGGGVLMSATLAPLEAFREQTKLKGLAELEGFSIDEAVYDIQFPPENRLSLTVELPEFTSNNRGSPRESNPVRERYAEAIRTVVRQTDGNVLVCLPSYAEAKWAASLLDDDPGISKPVLCDQSSSNAETKQLKEDFFRGHGKVLTTSLRGTLTEGVDYNGDRLDACIVAGVPIQNMDSPEMTARLNSYRYRFENGADYCLQVPAVRKTRQALGRVIRGEEDVGVRVLLDERYATSEGKNSVKEYLSPKQQEEFEVVDLVEDLKQRVQSFWR